MRCQHRLRALRHTDDALRAVKLGSLHLVVERLLTVTYARAFHHKPTLGSASALRGVNAVACLNFQAMADLTRDI